MDSLDPVGKKVLASGIEKAQQQFDMDHADKLSEVPHITDMQRMILQKAEASITEGPKPGAPAKGGEAGPSRPKRARKESSSSGTSRGLKQGKGKRPRKEGGKAEAKKTQAKGPKAKKEKSEQGGKEDCQTKRKALQDMKADIDRQLEAIGSDHCE